MVRAIIGHNRGGVRDSFAVIALVVFIAIIVIIIVIAVSIVIIVILIIIIVIILLILMIIITIRPIVIEYCWAVLLSTAGDQFFKFFLYRLSEMPPA